MQGFGESSKGFAESLQDSIKWLVVFVRGCSLYLDGLSFFRPELAERVLFDRMHFKFSLITPAFMPGRGKEGIRALAQKMMVWLKPVTLLLMFPGINAGQYLIGTFLPAKI